jgi:hypothetical protein
MATRKHKSNRRRTKRINQKGGSWSAFMGGTLFGAAIQSFLSRDTKPKSAPALNGGRKRKTRTKKNRSRK